MHMVMVGSFVRERDLLVWKMDTRLDRVERPVATVGCSPWVPNWLDLAES